MLLLHKMQESVYLLKTHTHNNMLTYVQRGFQLRKLWFQSMMFSKLATQRVVPVSDTACVFLCYHVQYVKVSEHPWLVWRPSRILASSNWAEFIDLTETQSNCCWSVVSGLFQCTNKLLLSDRATRLQIKEFARKHAANALSIANMVMGMASILSSLNGWVVFTSVYVRLHEQTEALQLAQRAPVWLITVEISFCPLGRICKYFTHLKRSAVVQRLTLAFFVQAPSRCVLAGSDWLPAGFGRWSGCQATQCLLCTGWVKCCGQQLWAETNVSRRLWHGSPHRPLQQLPNLAHQSRK